MFLQFIANRPPAKCRKTAPVAVTDTAKRLDRLERAGANLATIILFIERQEARLAQRTGTQ